MLRLDEYKHYLEEKGYARVTIMVGMPPLRAFETYLKKRSIKEITSTTLQQYFNYLKTKKYKDKTMRTKRIDLRRYFRFAVLTGDIEADPTAGIELPGNEIKRKLYFSMDQIK